MPKHKSLTISARVVLAGRLRKCHHVPRHRIHKGELCLEVRDGMAWKGYCVPCAGVMIQTARSTLFALESQIAASEASGRAID